MYVKKYGPIAQQNTAVLAEQQSETLPLDCSRFMNTVPILLEDNMYYTTTYLPNKFSILYFAILYDKILYFILYSTYCLLLIIYYILFTIYH